MRLLTVDFNAYETSRPSSSYVALHATLLATNYRATRDSIIIFRRTYIFILGDGIYVFFI